MVWPVFSVPGSVYCSPYWKWQRQQASRIKGKKKFAPFYNLKESKFQCLWFRNRNSDVEIETEIIMQMKVSENRNIEISRKLGCNFDGISISKK
jgi:hypothetical protein